jgi:hypothetical protein
VTSSKKNLILQGYEVYWTLHILISDGLAIVRCLNYMILSNTAPFTTDAFFFLSSTSTEAEILRIGHCTNCTAVLRHFLTWLLPKNMALTQWKSLSLNSIDVILSYLRTREEIAILTSLPLLRKVVQNLEAARNSGNSSLTLFFTKESHMHTLVNLVLLSGLPIANRRIPELDFAVGYLPVIEANLYLHLAFSHISRKE